MSHLNERLPIFTERFRELKGERNDTEFAEFLGVSRQTVGFFGNGNRLPDALTLIKIAQKCGVSTDWLLGLTKFRTQNIGIKKIGEYTGLTESAIAFLHSVCEKPKYTEVIGALLSNEVFPTLLDYVLEMRHAALESELGRQSENVSDGRIVRGYEHEIFLEYMIDTCVKTIVSEMTREWIEKEYPVGRSFE